MREKISLAVGVMLLITGQIFAQTFTDRRNAAMSGIDAALKTYEGGVFERAGDLVDVDSSINNPGIADGKIGDPYYTLKDCYLFMARTEQQGEYAVGVYRADQIVWLSDSLPGSDTYGEFDNGFLATMDMTRQGKVDIAAYFSTSSNPPVEAYLWIFSWNGSKGSRISQCNANGETAILSSGGFEVYDVDSDGIDEVLASSNGQRMNVVYSWNGSFYGIWPNTPTLTDSTNTVANNLTLTVHALARKLGDKMEYSYSIGNDKSSKQKVESFYVYSLVDTFDEIIPPKGWSGGKWSERPLVDCFTSNEDSMLSPGFRPARFSYVVQGGIPVIATFYSQAPHEALNLSPDLDPQKYLQGIYNDIITNSFKGTTIGAGDPPNRFVPLNLLDTLVSYKHQCVTLGWLTNVPEQGKNEDDDKAGEGIVERLDRRLDKAKDVLTKGDSVKARLELELFVKEVEQLYGKEDQGERSKEKGKEVLTSEGYALLKYNAEYLIDRLPGRHERGDEGEERGKK